MMETRADNQEEGRNGAEVIFNASAHRERSLTACLMPG